MADRNPNILFIMSDDHAAHAMSCYGSRINQTPNIDRIANEGVRFDNCFCTNAICAPSRAVILTGQYNHLCGVRTLAEQFDSRQLTFPKLLQQCGYQTAIIGKWHLGHGGHSDPSGFDYWNVLVGQGFYFDPKMIEMGTEKVFPGYVTDVITNLSLEWLDRRDKERPFMLMCHHKAPHRPWRPDDKHAHLYEGIELPEPETLFDDYASRAQATREAKMRMMDLRPADLKADIPEGLSPEAETSWRYQRYIKDYLRCIASVDENVGRLLDYLDAEGLADDTIVIYTSDQGFFLGDHGWFDKRFMYEESLRMPFVVRYPREVKAGGVNRDIVLNLDFAPTFLDYAGLVMPSNMQGSSLRSVFNGHTPTDWRTSMYYRYWMHCDNEHNICAHYGIRTERYKLIYYYGEALDAMGARDLPKDPEWELFDLVEDPAELNNVFASSTHQDVVQNLMEELSKLQAAFGDRPVVK